VADAKWVTNARKLLVVYDADLFGAAELADYLDTCGISVAGVRAAHAWEVPDRFARAAHAQGAAAGSFSQLDEHGIECPKST
jgi:hypothetical protein